MLTAKDEEIDKILGSSVDSLQISFLIFPTAYDTDRWEQGHDANG